MKWIKRFFEFWLIFIMTGISASLVLVITLIAITVVNTHWKTDRFRFENFETAEELIEYIKTNYPNGSDGTPLIALLDDAGAKCELIPEKYYSKKDKELGTYSLYQCFYGAGWLYWPTLIGYGVWLSLDENQKLMDFSANREWNGF